MAYLKTWIWSDQIQRFRIPCPEGAICFGVFDESRTLQYDDGEGFPEVFVQVNGSPRLS